ncbi:adenosine deaminase [Ramlibacter sp. 2FC]|uniref:adenosine deaminase n=1 Tax=Ramlibacter sp. 2FC TaxID=2502188 RepID=UPI0010FA4C7A|nr:adenosine deaminase [Ramlibacter sp. 2FC]
MPAIPSLITQLPKVELHCHLAGTLRPATLAALAGKYGQPLPRPVEELYVYRDFYDFIDLLRLVARVLRRPEDFEWVAYEAIEDAFRSSNVRHIEMSFNPQYFIPAGAAYAAQVEGLVAGIEAAERDFPVSALLLASFDREWSVASANETMDLIVGHRHERIVGIGLDGPERAGPPARFEDIYRRATRAGLKKTAHVCEDNQTLAEAPPSNFDACLDILHCDRLDHGYNLLACESAVHRARDSGIYFAVCGITSVAANRSRRLAAIERMTSAGLQVTLNTDDPAMFHTDLAHTYRHVLEGLNWGWDEAKRFSLAGVDACWLDAAAKAELRQDFLCQIAALEAPSPNHETV